VICRSTRGFEVEHGALQGHHVIPLP
jgi:hypothetical protein